MALPYLREHPPRLSQFRSPRRARPTGLTVLHTAESVLDTVGPDTGAEAVAAFIRGRTTYGSYHDLVDSDSALQLVAYGDEAYQDGTGSNPFALSISWALAAADWPRLTGERRDAFLRQGAVAFARQQAWLREHGYPATQLRRLTKAESDRGLSGFIKHGDRDPGRRSDPGAGFPWERWFELLDTPPAPVQAGPTVSQEATVELIGKLDVIRKGSDDKDLPGQPVKNVQRLLLGREVPYADAASWVDGVFGAGTQGAVERFQAGNDLPATGVVDGPTWYALNR